MNSSMVLNSGLGIDGSCRLDDRMGHDVAASKGYTAIAFCGVWGVWIYDDIRGFIILLVYIDTYTDFISLLLGGYSIKRMD